MVIDFEFYDGNQILKINTDLNNPTQEKKGDVEKSDFEYPTNYANA